MQPMPQPATMRYRLLDHKHLTKQLITHIEQNRFLLPADLLGILMSSDGGVRATVEVDKPHVAVCRFSIRTADRTSRGGTQHCRTPKRGHGNHHSLKPGARDMTDTFGKLLGPAVLLLAAVTITGWATQTEASEVCPENLAFEMRPLAEQQPVSLCQRYSGKVILVVNTASRCGFTPQFKGLEKLYQRYKARGLVVLGFPSNDFAQELSDEAEIRGFCRLSYGVKFPMFEKIKVTGDAAHPFYKRLAAEANTQPGWNFHKYLLDRDGRVSQSFVTMTRPEDPRLLAAIEALL